MKNEDRIMRASRKRLRMMKNKEAENIERKKKNRQRETEKYGIIGGERGKN